MTPRRAHMVKLLSATVLTVVALLINPSPGRHDAPFWSNVAEGDSLLQCFVTMDGSPVSPKGINGGMSAFLMKKYASDIRIKPRIVFIGKDALDSLLDTDFGIVAVMMSDSLPEDGFLPTREIGDSVIWLVKAAQPDQLLGLNAWITDIVDAGDYPKLKNDYLRIRRTGNRISPFDEFIKRYAAQNGWDWRLIAAVIRHESRFKTDVVSPAGAIGLMQIIPYRHSAEQLFNPEYNVMAGTEHLSRMRKMFKPYSADSVQNVKFTLAAYNAGEGRVLECIRFAKSIGVDATCWDSIARRSIPRMRTFSGAQTIPYVDSILRTYRKYQDIYDD